MSLLPAADHWRSQFPIFQHQTYINSCSQGALSHDVRAAYSAYLAGWGTATGEMSNTLNSLLVTPNKDKGVGTTNRSRYSNKAMDKLVEDSADLMDPAKRGEMLAKASEMAMADFAMLPIHLP